MPVHNNVFDGLLRIYVKGQVGLTRAQRSLINRSFNEGIDLPREVRFTCRIATDINDTIAEGLSDAHGKTYAPNSRVRAQFGRNRRGLPYLTFGVIDTDTRTPYTLTWEGDAVPTSMIKAAVAHDEGRETRDACLVLPLAAAQVYQTGAKHSNRQPRGRRDLDKNGVPYPRKKRTGTKNRHDRLCSTDVDERQATDDTRT